MSIEYMSKVWELSQHSGDDLVTLLALADEADHLGRCYMPNHANLRRKTRLNAIDLTINIGHLMESGELELSQTWQGYTINLPAIELSSTEDDEPIGIIDGRSER